MKIAGIVNVDSASFIISGEIIRICIFIDEMIFFAAENFSTSAIFDAGI